MGIPFFSSLLSVMSSLFNCWFGFMFWALAYFRMRRVDLKIGRTRPVVGDYLSMALNVIIMLTGAMYLTLGTYVSVQGIIDAFDAGTVPGVFSCARRHLRRRSGGAGHCIVICLLALCV